MITTFFQKKERSFQIILTIGNLFFRAYLRGMKIVLEKSKFELVQTVSIFEQTEPRKLFSKLKARKTNARLTKFSQNIEYATPSASSERFSTGPEKNHNDF